MTLPSLVRGMCALLVFAISLIASAQELVSLPQTELLTNLLQLRQSAVQDLRFAQPFRVIADVVDADPATSVLVLRDSSAVEFIRVDFSDRHIERGATVCLEGLGCGLKLKGFGVSVAPGLVVDNDGIHPVIPKSGKIFLRAGWNPINLRWFDWLGVCGLDVDYEGPNLPRQRIPSSVLSRMKIDPATGRTNFSAGLDYRCYEGVWEFLPDFRKLRPVRTGVATNFDLGVRTREGTVGLEFNGYIRIPETGVYTFHVASDDGSQLFVGEPSVNVRVLSKKPAPLAADGVPASISERTNFPLVTLEGTVTAAGIWVSGGELLMRVGGDDIRVEVFDSSDFKSDVLLHHKARVTGIYQNVFTEDGSRAPGRLLVLNCKAIQMVATQEVSSSKQAGDEKAPSVPSATVQAETPLPISTVADIKSLSPEQAKQKLPVSIRGVVTAWFSTFAGAVVQDSTRGVFIELIGLRDMAPLQRGELCQVEGVTGPGLFSPVIVANRITPLGQAQLPKPVRATWDRLVNGSLDTEYAEIDGVVTAVRDWRVVLLTEGGKIALELRDCRPETLTGYVGAVVRIRGCVFVNFNIDTHQLETGSLVVRSATVDVLQPAARDFFDAAHRTIGELLLYDPKAAPFRLLKVSGQIIYGRPGEYFLTDGTNGMHVKTRSADSFSVGDVVDAAGFLELGGPAAELREAVMRKTGTAPLRTPAKLAQDELLRASYADTLVRIEAMLMNQWREGSEYVLELQAGFLAFKARINSGNQTVSLPPIGSRLELTGVYEPQGARIGDGTVSGFELLLPSPADVRILSTPPWWTLRRVLALSGVLAVLLLGVLVWNKQLHRQVQERSRKLELEIRNRQQAELQRAAEAERSRIARDLHDELGTGLTEVSLLASTAKSDDRCHLIAEKARALVSNLDVIVWAIDPKRNSLQSFADYLGRYATELFSATNIVCRFKIPIECDAVALSENARHSLFLAVKEALNNVIRHASATEVELQISRSNDHLQIVIADNGRGIDWNGIRRGNGLTNLRERLEALNGECQVESQPGKGTLVKLTVPVPRDSS